jgi:hypothetical protein
MKKFIFTKGTLIILSCIAISTPSNASQKNPITIKYTPSGSMAGVKYITMINTPITSYNIPEYGKDCQIAQFGQSVVSNAIVWNGAQQVTEGGYCLVEIDPKEFNKIFSGCLLQNLEFNPAERSGSLEPKISVRLAQDEDRVFFEWYGFYTDFEYICFLK